jgi:hypothetical protein
MNSRNILILIAVLAVSLIGSVFLGSAVAKSEFNTVAGFVVGAMALTLYLVLGKNVWVLIPVFAYWTGNIGILPIPFSVNNLVVGFVLICWIINILSKRENLGFSLKSLDAAILLLLVVMSIGYARNPVSIAILGGNSVGARPYFEMGMGLMAYVMLSSVRVDPIWVNRVPYMTVISCAILAIGGAIAYFIPTVGFIASRVYSGFLPNMNAVGFLQEGAGEITRAGYLTPLALSITALLYAKRAPLMNFSFRHPLRTVFLGFALLLALLTGFRGAIGQQAAYFVIGSGMWWKGKGLVLTGLMATLVIAGVFVVSMLFELPFGAQRSLSFLPGDWDQKLITNTQRSNEFRFDMWHRAWYEDGIKDVWLGDGYRIPMSQLEYQKGLMAQGYVNEEERITYYLITGDLHSGPLSAIKYVGVLGLIVFLILSIMIAVQAWKLWNYAISKNSNLMIGFYVIPMIYFPVAYMFIFGSFRIDLSRVLVSAGLLILLKNIMRDSMSDENQEEIPAKEVV